MRIIKLDKPYSWLQWPVKLRNNENPHLHITAKFFGRVPIDPAAVGDAVRMFKDRTYGSGDIGAWRPAFWNELVHVLELTDYPTSMRMVHETFDIIKDQWPEFRPHITVTKEYHDWIRQNNVPPEKELLLIGPLELCLGDPDKE